MKSDIIFVGKINKDGWDCYQWLVRINNVTFDYYTGLGHAKEKVPVDERKGKWTYRMEFSKFLAIPQIDGVLDCLFSDEEAGSYSFNDFCDNFGSSSDSIEAFDTYRHCMETGQKLRKALGKEYQACKNRVLNREEIA